MSATSATLEIRGVSRRFGKNTAVSAVDLSIPQGQMVGIIGRSGAGKSTLLRMINRLIDPSQGSIFLTAPKSQACADRRCVAGSATAP